MLKLLAALLLAGLLAVVAYGGFWVVCLNYTKQQMQGAVERGIGAQMTYGTTMLVPDLAQVAMDLPAAKLVMRDGPVRELRASMLRLEAGFMVRDRWRLKLPPRVEVQLANGATLFLETDGGEVLWLPESSTLSLRANTVKLMDLNGHELVRVSEVMLERRATDGGVRLNLASRPQWGGKEALLSGEVLMPEAALAAVLDLYGKGTLPGLGQVVSAVMNALQAKGGELELDNVSFKHDDESGAVYGKVRVDPAGVMTGSLVVSGDSPARLTGWVQQAGLVKPRNLNEDLGWSKLRGSIDPRRPTLRLENMQSMLMVNGYPIGPLPVAREVVGRLW